MMLMLYGTHLHHLHTKLHSVYFQALSLFFVFPSVILLKVFGWAEVKNEALLTHSSFPDLLLFDSKQQQLQFFCIRNAFLLLFFMFFFFFLQIEELLNGARIQKSNLLEVQRKCPWSKAAHIHPPAASKRIHSKSTTNEYMDWNILPLSFFVKCHSNEKSVGHCK